LVIGGPRDERGEAYEAGLIAKAETMGIVEHLAFTGNVDNAMPLIDARDYIVPRPRSAMRRGLPAGRILPFFSLPGRRFSPPTFGHIVCQEFELRVLRWRSADPGVVIRHYGAYHKY